MEKKQNCSCKSHKEIDATSYCEQCKIFMCNKCLEHHKELFEEHQQYNIDLKKYGIFIDICKEIGHEKKLEFFCKNHNELCCGLCISKLKDKGYGQHKDCDVCSIENIKEVKKNDLNDNIKYLEDLSKNLENTINELKNMFENINKKREELKSNIQKIFSKIRTSIDERENELLSDVDNKFNEKFCKEDIIEKSSKLPDKIKLSLEKAKLSDNDWNNDNKLSSLINDCLNVEKNIKNINNLNDKINNCKKYNNYIINFTPQDNKVDKFIHKIKKFGQLDIVSNFFEDSLIVKNEEDSKKLYELISKKIKIKNIKLIYRASKDGDKYKTVTDKLNNKSNLLFIYLTGNQRIFGNYLKVKLEDLGKEKDKYYQDENAFVFSLNNNKIYKILKPELAIRFCGKSKPIVVGNNGNTNGYYQNMDTIYDGGLLDEPKVYDFENNYELTDGKNEFNELEIFEIH